jgi:acyl-CoA reductase-like NAD-dependent aldehyde dehydrogenase
MPVSDLSAKDGAVVSRVATFLKAPKTLLIAGKWSGAQGGGSIGVVDPSTEKEVSACAAGEAGDIDAAVNAARAAFDAPGWRLMSAERRERLLLILADLVEKHGEELAALESLDVGTPISVTRNMAVAGAASVIRYNAGWVRRLGGTTAPVSVPGEWHAYTAHDPVGVAGLITPWNAPLPIVANKVSAALAAGCTVVLKPAELTPLTAVRFGELIEEAGFPPGVVNIVTGFGRTAGAALASHPGVDKISFTGSTATGKAIVTAAVASMKRVSLELGGKSPVIVFDDANLQRAIPMVAMGIFGNSGQVCAAGSRLFVHEKVADALLEGVAAFARNLKIGSGLDETTQLGPLISEPQRQRVRHYIESGLSQGAQLLVGGGIPERAGYFVEPTIFVKARPDMAIVREEIFGPVLSAMRFRDEDIDTLAAMANDTQYGLSSNIWTRDLSNAHRLAARLRAGTVRINGGGMEFAMPFGGFKMSGVGRENGRDGVVAFTETKSVLANLD